MITLKYYTEVSLNFTIYDDHTLELYNYAKLNYNNSLLASREVLMAVLYDLKKYYEKIVVESPVEAPDLFIELCAKDSDMPYIRVKVDEAHTQFVITAHALRYVYENSDDIHDRTQLGKGGLS